MPGKNWTFKPRSLKCRAARLVRSGVCQQVMQNMGGKAVRDRAAVRFPVRLVASDGDFAGSSSRTISRADAGAAGIDPLEGSAKDAAIFFTPANFASGGKPAK